MSGSGLGGGTIGLTKPGAHVCCQVPSILKPSSAAFSSFLEFYKCLLNMLCVFDFKSKMYPLCFVLY